MSKSLRVVMLSTEKASQLFKNRHTNELCFRKLPDYTILDQNQNQHLYLIDENAAIQVGDYLMSIPVHEVRKRIYDAGFDITSDTSIQENKTMCKYKIIASTDTSLGLPTFSDDLIQQYVANPDMEISGYTIFNNELVSFENTTFEEEDNDDYVRYCFRNFQESEIEGGWCVKGVYTRNGFTGVQEWCLSEEDAKERMRVMKESREFTDLCIANLEGEKPDEVQQFYDAEKRFSSSLTEIYKIANKLAFVLDSSVIGTVALLIDQLMHVKNLTYNKKVIDTLLLIRDESLFAPVRYIVDTVELKYQSFLNQIE